MTLPSNDHAYLRNVAPDQLAALIFELASQLHVERQRRIALETALQRAGLLQTDTLDALAADTEIQNMGREALDLALRRLLRIVTETGDPRGPLRAEHC
ncbi:hypothetical protein [Sphingobium phenoxybenzoativorans]|uniref:hypothetical protein n=1 Tax=Sphingobium phenoxybenzoativorans TaxID=1592790 RepID=UPI000872F786|nr:hypothetical protein [Sphingobium phenoxybenzoativorans]